MTFFEMIFEMILEIGKLIAPYAAIPVVVIVTYLFVNYMEDDKEEE
tara:strand:- start:101 stop:238 length:138 start_codon:yes stop_codon:yes gene_type:complete